MADLDPKGDVLKNLELLLDMEIIKNEKDWDVIKALDQQALIESAKKDEGNGKDTK